MAKHTPGPWGVGVYGIDQEIATVAHVGQHVVGVPSPGIKGGYYDGHGDEGADAQLIAAAPDMLGALRMVGMLRQLGGMLPGSREIVQSIVDAADAAIAKATAPIDSTKEAA